MDQGNLDVPAGAGNVEVKPVLLGVPASFISRRPFLPLHRKKENGNDVGGEDRRSEGRDSPPGGGRRQREFRPRDTVAAYLWQLKHGQF